jgi:2-aminobenzoate-CoA ligase
VKTGRDDVALLGFTSGTTGEPKATMHFHRDLLIIADGYAKEVLKVTPEDVFVGSPPLAFTFGLGGLAVFPLRFGAAAALLEQATPAEHDRDHPEHRKATVCFTAPYRLPGDAEGDGGGGRPVVAARRGQSRAKPCPRRSMTNGSRRPASRCWTGSARPRCCTSSSPTALTITTPAAPGRPVTGYEARIVDEDMQRASAWGGWRLAVAWPDRLPLSGR